VGSFASGILKKSVSSFWGHLNRYSCERAAKRFGGFYKMSNILETFKKITLTENEDNLDLLWYRTLICKWIDNHPFPIPSHTPSVHLTGESSIVLMDVAEWFDLKIFDLEWFVVSEINGQLYLLMCQKPPPMGLRSYGAIISKVFIFPLNEHSYEVLQDLRENYTQKGQRAMAFHLLHNILHNHQDGEPLFTHRERERILDDFLPTFHTLYNRYPAIRIIMLDPFLFTYFPENENDPIVRSNAVERILSSNH